jgi:hypothetical protein
MASRLPVRVWVRLPRDALFYSRLMTGRLCAAALSEQDVDILASRNLRVGGSQAVAAAIWDAFLRPEQC